MITSLQIPDFTDLLGVPYAGFGKDIEMDGGLDCEGLCDEIARRAMLSLDPNDWKVIEEEPFFPMDRFALGLKGEEVPTHLAVHLGDWWILHSSDPIGVARHNLACLPFWLGYAYRYKETC